MNQIPGTLNVMLIEDQREVRDGLAVLINGSPGFCCVASFRTMEEHSGPSRSVLPTWF